MTTQWEFTSPFEGIVDHMYLDTRGNVTVGVGFMLPSELSARELPWQPGVWTGDIIHDWHAVHGAENGHVASYYLRFTKCSLTRVAMRGEFEARMVGVALELSNGWQLTVGSWGLAKMPESARIALCDMGYNLGTHALLTKWPRLEIAVRSSDWAECADECHRVGVSQARNDATRKAFLQAAAEAASSV